MIKKWLLSLLLSTFFPFIPEELRDKANHIMAGGMLFVFFCIILPTIIIIIFLF